MGLSLSLHLLSLCSALPDGAVCCVVIVPLIYIPCMQRASQTSFSLKFYEEAKRTCTFLCLGEKVHIFMGVPEPTPAGSIIF